MAQNIAVDLLYKQLDRIKLEKQASIDRFDDQISKLQTAIDQLDGKKVWSNEPAELYDDTNPDYIKNSQEEI